MSRKGASALVLLALVAGLVAVSAPATAARRPTPVITKAPTLVRYGDTIKIVGRLENGRPRHKVRLKQRLIGIGRTVVNEKRVGEDLAVRFFITDAEMSANYRLIFENRRGVRRKSEIVRVEVKPRLRFDVRPSDTKANTAVALTGRFAPARPDRRVRIQVRKGGPDGDWRFLKGADVSDGVFRKEVVAEMRGELDVRAVFAGDDLNPRVRRKDRLWVYTRGPATWYGPGFYGNTTACGQTLRKTTLGVAHRTLPCGTPVHFLYEGKRITVDVIDRGPYGEADWDLTNATKERLGFEGRDVLGFIVHRHSN